MAMDKPYVGVRSLVYRNNQVLLIQRKSSLGSGMWCPPGGRLEPGETFEICAARETREETGILISTPQFRAITNNIYKGEGKHGVTVWMEAEFRSGELKVNMDEVAAAGWFHWDALPVPLFVSFNNLLQGRGYPGGKIRQFATIGVK